MTDYPAGYYSRFDPNKNYERHLFRAGYVLQSAELNELQESSLNRMQGISDSLFKDGSIIRDCVVVVDPTTGATTCNSGAIYLRGAVRGIPPQTFTIPVVGTIAIGIRLIETVVTETDDPDLKDPAVGLRNYARAGAARLKLEPQWGWDGDGSTADFFPVYTVDGGILRPKEAPPQIDSVTQAIARYDRDSSGGTYVVAGLNCQILPDDGSNQVYSISDGSARVRGNGVTLSTSRRVVIDPAPDLRYVETEPHLSSGTSSQRVNLNLYPVKNVVLATITAQKTVTLTHGAYSGASDVLPDASVLSIVSVTQGATTYAATTDYLLTGNSVDWSPAGAEPATGSTYSVTYNYITSVTPDSVDASGLYVTGALAGTLILVSYNQFMPRIDRICLADDGQVVFIKGVSANANPMAPMVPDSLLPLATITQTWDANRSIDNDGVRVVPMKDLAAINARIDHVLGLVAQQGLESNVHSREANALKGLFTDPFLDDSQRDAGIAQTAAIYNGVLALPITVSASDCDSRSPGTASTMASSTEAVVSQILRSNSKKVNPYMAFAPLPAVATLDPSLDRWVNINTVWSSPITRLIAGAWTWFNRSNLLATVSSLPSMFLRSRTINFSLTNFAPNEPISTITFDGITLLTAAYTADASGAVSGSFTIPANVPVGSKLVVFNGAYGTTASATYVGQGIDQITTRTVVTQLAPRFIDPLAETFTLPSSRQVKAIGLWFTAKGTKPVEVQIRETSNGVPTQTVLTSARLAASAISLSDETIFTFSNPVFLQGGVEYAMVVLTDDATTACATAVLGEFDNVNHKWVTEQPYQIGVLLSSSNASTWTAHQAEDLTFRIYAATFTETTKTVSLGTVAVTGATDLSIRANVENPSSATDCTFLLQLPDGSTQRVVADQVVQLASPVTGNVTVSAELKGTTSAAPILHRDVQLVWGVISSTGSYVSRAIPGGTSVKLRVIIEVLLPGSSSIAVSGKGTTDGSWTALSQTASQIMQDGWVELTYESALLTKTLFQAKIDLSGSSQYRPQARNLRVLVV